MNTKLILTTAIAITVIPHAGAAEKREPFVPRMTSLRGASLQPSSGLHASAGLQTSSELQATRGVEPSADRAGRAPIQVRPMSEAEWRRIFPSRNTAK